MEKATVFFYIFSQYAQGNTIQLAAISIRCVGLAVPTKNEWVVKNKWLL